MICCANSLFDRWILVHRAVMAWDWISRAGDSIRWAWHRIARWRWRWRWDRIIELALVGLLVVFGGIQLGINDRQGKITKRQTEIMERQVRLSEVVERPWIAIEYVEPTALLNFR